MSVRTYHTKAFSCTVVRKSNRITLPCVTLDWLPSNWYMYLYQNKNENIIKKSYPLQYLSLWFGWSVWIHLESGKGKPSSLILFWSEECLMGKGDDTCRKIVKEEYFTFVTWARLVLQLYAYRTQMLIVQSQQTYNVVITSLQRRSNVTTLQRRCNDVVATLCVCWGCTFTLHILCDICKLTHVTQKRTISSYLITSWISQQTTWPGCSLSANTFNNYPNIFQDKQWKVCLGCEKLIWVLQGRIQIGVWSGSTLFAQVCLSEYGSVSTITWSNRTTSEIILHPPPPPPFF